jgi:hypothetical protein
MLTEIAELFPFCSMTILIRPHRDHALACVIQRHICDVCPFSYRPRLYYCFAPLPHLLIFLYIFPDVVSIAYQSLRPRVPSPLFLLSTTHHRERRQKACPLRFRIMGMFTAFDRLLVTALAGLLLYYIRFRTRMQQSRFAMPAIRFDSSSYTSCIV